MRSVLLASSALVLPLLSGCIVVGSGSSYDRTRYSSEELAAVTQVYPGEFLPSVRSRRQADLVKLSPGMSEQEVRALIPDTVFVETRTVDGETWTAYSLSHSERYRFVNDDQIFTVDDQIWLYFRNGDLVRTGRPNKWGDEDEG